MELWEEVEEEVIRLDIQLPKVVLVVEELVWFTTLLGRIALVLPTLVGAEVLEVMLTLEEKTDLELL